MTASQSVAAYARRLRELGDTPRPVTLRCVDCARRAASAPWPDATAGPVCAACEERRRKG